MATPYQDVYAVFIRKITDYSLSGLTQSEFEDVISGFLDSACTKFKKDCKVDLGNRDNITKLFNVTLADVDKEILGTMMIVEWLTPLTYTTEVAKQGLTDRDFKFYSQANHLGSLLSLLQKIEDDVNSLITDYTYNKIDLEALR